MYNKYVIVHHGVLGQKWGVRKQKRAAQKRAKVARDAKKVKDKALKKEEKRKAKLQKRVESGDVKYISKHANSFSNEQIDKAIKRYQAMEQAKFIVNKNIKPAGKEELERQYSQKKMIETLDTAQRVANLANTSMAALKTATDAGKNVTTIISNFDKLRDTFGYHESQPTISKKNMNDIFNFLGDTDFGKQDMKEYAEGIKALHEDLVKKGVINND